MKLKIITPKGRYFEGDVEILNVHTIDGQLGILSHHQPLVTMLTINELNFRDQQGQHHYAISGGVLYVGQQETIVMTEAIESKDEIDVERAKQAYQKAKERLEQAEEIDLQKATIALQKAINRIRVSGNDL